MGGDSEGRIEFSGLLPKSDSRILQPTIVHSPCFADGSNFFPQHCRRCQETQQSHLGESAKNKSAIALAGKPVPRFIGLKVVGPAQGKPHIQIRQIRRRTDSPGRDCPRQACPSYPPVVPLRSAMAVAEAWSRWRWLPMNELRYVPPPLDAEVRHEGRLECR